MSEPPQPAFRAAGAQQPAVAPSALALQAQQIVTMQKDTATMLESLFRTVEAATIHAAKVVMPNVTAKIAEMDGLLAKESELVAREQRLAEANAAHVADKERHAGALKEFEAHKLKWQTDRAIESRAREQNLYQRYITPEYFALPSALRGEDAQELVKALIPSFEDGSPDGGRLRASLTAVALAEGANEEDDFLKAVQELYQPALESSSVIELAGHLKRLLSGKGKEPITIEIPQPAEPYDPRTMAPTTLDLAPGRPISKVIKWGVKFANKDKRKKALVA